MQELDFLDLEANISQPRLRTYTQLAGSTDTVKLIGAYQWNKRVASALYPILQCLEVTLRNAVHTNATQHFNTPDWFDKITKLAGNDMFLADMKKNPYKQNKFYRNGVSTGSRKGLKIWTSYHENMLKQAKDKLTRSGKKSTADSVVAELMLGFWVGIFESNYNDIQTKDRLWPHLEGIVFPNLKPSDRVHSKIHAKLEPIQKLRNRLSHHEPVWKHPSVNGPSMAISHLNNIVDDMISLINGISTHRKELLFRSGKISYFKGICSDETLNYYLSGAPITKLDKRRLKRHVEKAIKSPQIAPTIVTDKKNPKFVIDLWPPR